jgi:predicted nucleic acid-binding protein
VKRYVAEPGSEVVRAAMQDAERWFMCRVGFVETMRAVGQVGGTRAAAAFKAEWSAFGVVAVDQPLADHAAALTLERELRSLDALHLAAALVLPPRELLVATWDRRLHAAAAAEGLRVLPDPLG